MSGRTWPTSDRRAAHRRSGRRIKNCTPVPKTSKNLCHVTAGFVNIGAVPAHTRRLFTFTVRVACSLVQAICTQQLRLLGIGELWPCFSYKRSVTTKCNSYKRRYRETAENSDSKIPSVKPVYDVTRYAICSLLQNQHRRFAKRKPALGWR